MQQINLQTQRDGVFPDFQLAIGNAKRPFGHWISGSELAAPKGVSKTPAHDALIATGSM